MLQKCKLFKSGQLFNANSVCSLVPLSQRTEITIALMAYERKKYIQKYHTTYILGITSIDVHLSQPIMRQHKVRRRELGCLVVILEGLVAVALGVKGTREVVAAFSAHRFVLSIVERM